MVVLLVEFSPSYMDLQQIPMNIFIFSASSREVKMGAFLAQMVPF